MDFSTTKKITIPEGEVKQISVGNTVIWKGTWTFTINIGDYVSSVKYSDDNTNWTTITSSTTVEVDSGKILYVRAESYNTNDVYWDYTPYSFSLQFSDDIGDDGGSITVYQTRARHYYTSTITAGNYVSTVKAKVNDGNWANASSSVSVQHLYEDTVHWEAVDLNTTTAQYTYSGTTMGDFTNSQSQTITVSQTRTLRSYRIRFYNGNSLLQSGYVNYGSTPTYNGSTPTKAQDNNYKYTFSGWSPSITSVTSNQDYYAQFSQTQRVYTTTVTAGSNVQTVRVKAGNGSWTNAGSSASINHSYNQTIYWEMVSYNRTHTDGYIVYPYSGDTSGSFNGGTGTTKTVSRTAGASYHRPPQEDDFNFSSYDYDGSYYEWYWQTYFDQNFSYTIEFWSNGSIVYQGSYDHYAAYNPNYNDDSFSASKDFDWFTVRWSWNGQSGNFDVNY